MLNGFIGSKKTLQKSEQHNVQDPPLFKYDIGNEETAQHVTNKQQTANPTSEHAVDETSKEPIPDPKNTEPEKEECKKQSQKRRRIKPETVDA